MKEYQSSDKRKQERPKCISKQGTEKNPRNLDAGRNKYIKVSGVTQ